MDPLRRLARPLITVAIVAIVAPAAVVLAPGAVEAASGTKTTFAAVVDRSAVVVVATVQDAPTVSVGYLLSVERVIKGAPRDPLTFAPDPRAVALVPGQRVVLLLTDPSGLDFRGTVALTVSADGSIDPDGLADVPATLADLDAAYGGSASIPPTATIPPADPPARDPVALLVLVAASLAAGVALVLAHGAASGRRRT